MVILSLQVHMVKHLSVCS